MVRAEPTDRVDEQGGDAIVAVQDANPDLAAEEPMDSDWEDHDPDSEEEDGEEEDGEAGESSGEEDWPDEESMEEDEIEQVMSTVHIPLPPNFPDAEKEFRDENNVSTDRAQSNGNNGAGRAGPARTPRPSFWVYLYTAVKQLREKGGLTHANLLENAPLTDEFLLDLEDSMETFLEMKRPTSPTNEKETELSISYENQRVAILKMKSAAFNRKNGTRPGFNHKYGALFPVQMSYDLLDYLVYAMAKNGMDFDDSMENNDIWHPELNEIDPTGRRLMESCFIMDSSVRQEYIDLVKALRKSTGVELTKNEVQIVTNVFDGMNSLFNLNFEHFLMDNADLVKNKRAIIHLREEDEESFNAKNDEFNEVYRVLQAYMNDPAGQPLAHAP